MKDDGKVTLKVVVYGPDKQAREDFGIKWSLWVEDLKAHIENSIDDEGDGASVKSITVMRE